MQSYLVYVTFVDNIEAERISKIIIEEKLVACVNIFAPIKSLYMWEGEIQQSAEITCVFKTSAMRYPDLEKRIIELHSYTTPCIVAVPIVAGSLDFLHWVSESTN